MPPRDNGERVDPIRSMLTHRQPWPTRLAAHALTVHRTLADPSVFTDEYIISLRGCGYDAVVSMIRARDAAELSGVSDDTVRRWIGAGEQPASAWGRDRLVTAARRARRRRTPTANPYVTWAQLVNELTNAADERIVAP